MNEAQTFTIENFTGYYDGPSMAKLPPGALVDTRGVFAANVQVNESGELTGAGGFSRFGVNPTFGTGMHVNQLFHWTPSSGGSLVLVGAKYPGYLKPDSSNGITLGTLHYPEFSWDDRFDLGHPAAFSMFETFGDRCYYVDGVNFPLRIDFWENHPLPSVSPMGPIVIKGEDFITAAYKPFAALGGPVAPYTSYAFTTVSRYGESPAMPSLIKSVSLDTSVDPYTAGSTGTSVSFTINWSLVAHSERVLWVNVYRTPKGASNIYRYVGRVRYKIGGTSSFLDSKQDSELGDPLVLNNGLPTNFRLLASFGNRLFGVGGYGQYNRIACSKLGQPDIWPPEYELSQLDAGKGQNITYVKAINGNLYFFFTNRIMRLVGFTPEDFSLEEVDNHVGCSSPRGIVAWEDGVVFPAKSGVYFFNGTSRPRLVSNLYRLFERSELSDSHMSTICGAISNGYYYLSYLESERVSASPSSSNNNRVLILNLRNGSWGVRATGAFDLACQVSNNQALVTSYAASGCGVIYYLSDYPLQDNLHVSPMVPLAGIDMGSPHRHKIIDTISVWYEAIDEVDLSCSVYKDTPRVEAPVSGDPVSMETSNVTAGSAQSGASIPGKWGDAWADSEKVFGDVIPQRAVFSFDKMNGYVFTVVLNFNAGSVAGVSEVRIQKVIIRYRFESDPSKWGISQV